MLGGGGRRKNSSSWFYFQKKQNKQTTTITKKMESNYDYLQYKKIILIETFTRNVLAKLYEIALLVCQQRLNIDDFI